MTNIKYKRAKAASQWGSHNHTFNHIWSLIPPFIINKLSSKELALMIDEYHQKVFSLGKTIAIDEAIQEGAVFKTKGETCTAYTLTKYKS